MISGRNTEGKTGNTLKLLGLFLTIFILCVEINSCISQISGCRYYLLAFCLVPYPINIGKYQQVKLAVPHAVPDISVSWHDHLLGSSRVVVQNSSSSSVHTLDHQMIQHHFLLGPLDDLLLYRTLCDQAVNIHLNGKKRTELFPGDEHALLIEQPSVVSQNTSLLTLSLHVQMWGFRGKTSTFFLYFRGTS